MSKVGTGLASLCAQVIQRAILDYIGGVNRGYIKHGEITDRLSVAIDRERCARRNDASVANTRLESYTCMGDYATAILFFRDGGGLDEYIEAGGLRLDSDTIKDKINDERNYHTIFKALRVE